MMNRQAPEFATLLRRMRLAAGLSQDALAEHAGLSSVTISALERGTRRVPHRQTIALLADALHLAPSERALLENSAVIPARPRDRTPAAAGVDGNQLQVDTLPLWLTSFHGRERDVAELSEMLRERRLVTLWGVGGVGKTRLAVETAREVRAHFADGGVLVELAAVLDAEQVVTRIAAALKVVELQGRSIVDDLMSALRNRELLLVLDNCEHVLHAVADAVQRLLQGCAELRVLATSREPLRIAGERVYLVAPLALPEALPKRVPSLAELRQSPAIRLFVDRALDVTPALTAQSEEERRSLLAICERLDGVPLAIELAAARTNVLGLAALEAQLDDRFRLLTRGERTASARHQTLRATMDWSHSLLAKSERIAFRRLGIFVGGWTLEAAQAVCADGEEILRPDVFELLGSLVEKTIVVADVSGEKPRYRLLETTRAYALERLLENGERETVAHRHLAYFRHVAEESDETFGAVPIQDWLPPLRTDLDNFRAALRWAFGDGRSLADGVALVAALGWTFGRLSFFAEGHHWCRHALQLLATDYDSNLEADLQSALMIYHFYVDLDTDREAYEHAKDAGMRAADLYRELNDRRGLARTLPWLGRIYVELGQRAMGDELVNEGIAHARALSDRFNLSIGLSWKSITMEPENVSARRTLLTEALENATSIDDAVVIGVAENFLGVLDRHIGDIASARLHLEKGIESYERAGSNTAAIVGACDALAWCALSQGDAPGARAAVGKAIGLWKRCQAAETRLWSLLQIVAGIAVSEGRARSGARLFGAARRIHERLPPWKLYNNGKPTHELLLAHFRCALPEHELETLMCEGANWTIERAFEEALLV